MSRLDDIIKTRKSSSVGNSSSQITTSRLDKIIEKRATEAPVPTEKKEESEGGISNWFKAPSPDGANTVNVDPINTAPVIEAAAVGRVRPEVAQKAKEVGKPVNSVEQTIKTGENNALYLNSLYERKAEIEDRLAEIVVLKREIATQNPKKKVLSGYSLGTIKPLEEERLKLEEENVRIQGNIQQINYRNTQAKYAQYEADKNFSSFSQPDSTVQDDTYRYINDIDGSRAAVGREMSENAATSANDGVSFVETPDIATHFYEYLTPSETKRYNYIYKTQGGEAAQRYLDEMETSVLAPRYRQEQYTQNETYAEEHPVLGTVATFGANLVDTLTVPQKLISTVSGNYNPRLDAFANFTSDVRGTVAENIDNPIGKMAYQAGTSIVDMGIALGIGVAAGGWGSKAASVISQAIMSTSAGSQTLTEANARGLEPWQSVGLAIAAGGIEWITEKYSVEALFSKPQSVIGYLAKNMFSEGSEEMASELANNFVDLLVSGDKAKMNQRIDELILEGKTTAEASKIALTEHLKDVGYAGLLGAISGGIFGGVGSVKNANTLSWGKKITAIEGGTEKLIKVSEGLSAGDSLESTVLGTLAKEVRENPKSRYDVGTLGQAVAKQIEQRLKSVADVSGTGTKLAQTESKIRTLLQENGLEGVYGDKLKTLSNKAVVQKAGNKFATQAFGNVMDDEVYAGELTAAKELLNSKGFDGELFQAIVTEGKGVDITRARDEFIKVYYEGYTEAITPEEAVKDMSINALTNEQVEAVYAAGKTFADAGGKFSNDVQSVVDESQGSVAEVRSEELNVEGNVPNINTDNGAASETTRNVKQGRVVYEEGVDTSKFTEKQKNQIDFINTVAAVTGVEIHLFESKLDQNGMYDTPYNGKFDRGSNTLWIDVNAGKLGENIGDFALTRTLSHELTHFIRMNAPQEYMALMRFCFQKIGADKFNELVEGKVAKNESLDFEDAIEEVIASGCEMVLRDSKAIEQLARENRSLAQRILDFLKDFAEKVKKAFEGVNAVSDEAKLLEKYSDELVELWDKALKSAVGNNASNGDTAAMGDVYTQNSAAETQQKVSNSQDGAAESQQETSEAEQEPETSKHKNIPDGARPKGRDLSDYLDEDGMFEEREFTEHAIQEALWDSLDHQDEGHDNLIKVSKMPKYIVNKFGIEGDFYIYRDHAYENMVSEEQAIADGRPTKRGKEKVHFHDLGVERMNKALASINSPTMVIATKNKDGNPTVIMILDQFGNNGAPLYGVLSFYSKQGINGVFTQKPHIVLTIAERSFYQEGGRAGYNEIIENAIKEGRILDYDAKKRDDLSVIAESAGLGNITKSSLEKSLSQFRKEIKSFREKNNILYEDRTAELTDEQVIEQRLKNLKETDPDFKKLKSYNKFSYLKLNTHKQIKAVNSQIAKAEELYFNQVGVTQEEVKTRKKALDDLYKKRNDLNRRLRDIKSRQDKLYQDSQIEKIIEAERREMSQVAYDEYQRNVGEYRAARNKTETLGKIRRLRNTLSTMLSANTQKKHVPVPLMETTLSLLSDITDTQAADRDITERLQNFRDKFEELKKDPNVEKLLKEVYDEGLYSKIGDIKQSIKGKNLSELTNADLERIYEVTREVHHAVTNVNKLQAKNLQATREDAASALLEQLKEYAKENNFGLSFIKDAGALIWELYKPQQFFDKMGSDTLKTLYGNLKAGQDTYYRHIAAAKDFKATIAEKYGVKNKDLEEQHEFRIGNDSETVSLTVGQMMVIYVYNRRGQAKGHLLEGGFYYPDGVQKVKKMWAEWEKTDTNGHRLTEKEIETISNKLTEEQRNYADELQRYLAKNMGTLGNEVTLKLNGVAKFVDGHYFPILTANDYIMLQEGKAPAIPSLTSPGFSHDTIKGANNPIVLDNFNDMWGRHVSQMSMYNAFAVPLSDFTKVTNWQFKEGNKDEEGNVITAEHNSLQATVESVYGKGAKNYLNRFIDDLNGGVVTDDVKGIDRFLSKFKKAKTFASVSVFVQQFSSVARVIPYLGPIDTAKTFFSGRGNKTWKELVEYCPIAGIKDMGYYDMGVGRSAVDYILADTTSLDDVFSAPAAWADRVTWCWIWNACQQKAARENHTAKGSHENKVAAAKLFNQVIENTQVYDSVFSRSQIMRRKGVMTKMATAFMAEPMTSLNMLMNSIDRLKQKNNAENRVFFTKTIGALVSNAILNSLLYSLVAAARDDDDEEMDYLEKYAGSVVGNTIDNLLPHNWIPIVRDVWSIFRGYDVKRTDIALYEDIVFAIQNLFNENVPTWERIADFIGAGANFFGVPVSNMKRDVLAVFNVIKRGCKDATLSGAIDSMKLELINYSSRVKNIAKLPSKTDLYYSGLYNAVISGDGGEYDRIFGELEESGKSTNEIKSGFKAYLREHDDRIKEAYGYYTKREAADEDSSDYTTADEAYNRIVDELVSDGFKVDIVTGAITGYSPKKTEEEKAAEENFTAAHDERAEEYTGDIYSVAIFNTLNADKQTKVISQINSYAREELKSEQDRDYEMKPAYKKVQIAEAAGITPAEYYSVIESAASSLQKDKIRAVNNSALSDDEKVVMRRLVKGNKKNLDFIEEYVRRKF